MKRCVSLLIVVISLFNFGCASILSGTSQFISLRSEQPGTKFYLNNEDIGTDSTVVQISKKNLSKSFLVAKKQGCSDRQLQIQTKFDPLSLLGILIDLGIFSIIVVDWAVTGAVQEAERTSYVLSPNCGT